jgi:DNA mismatch repair protein MutS
MHKSENQTPIMKQYCEIKSKYPDTLLLFRVGDFYESFNEDAIKCSKILNILLTKRSNGTSKINLAGFPCHSIDNFLPKLIKTGIRVAICDQIENTENTTNLKERVVTKIITPGVILEEEVLKSKSNNYLASLHIGRNKYGLSLLDISTGEFLVSEGNLNYIHQLLKRFTPKEILYQKEKKNDFIKLFGNKLYNYAMEDWIYQYDITYNKLLKQFHTKSLKCFSINELKEGIISAGVILYYLDNTKNNKIKHISYIQKIKKDMYVWIDDFTINNLEVLHSNNPNGISLLKILDQTYTSMGARLLKKWIILPLKKKDIIIKRQNIVEGLIKNKNITFYNISINLKNIADIERLTSKISSEKITPRELITLCESLDKIMLIKKNLLEYQSVYIKELSNKIPDYKIINTNILKILHVDAPHIINKGNVISNGVSKELDKLRDYIFSSKDYINELCQSERIKTKISSLKISFNNIFGYYIDVRNIHKNKVPNHWVRKQTLSNSERYITQELKDYEIRILGAEEKSLKLEYSIFKNLINFLQNYIQLLQHGSKIIAYLDVLVSFTKNAIENNYTRPILNDGFTLLLEEARHPVIEKTLPQGRNYITNTILLDPEKTQIMIITGPNMSGKSAILRTTALIVLMAQIGSYVPAKNASIGIIDKIFSRVGASDNLSIGESTFMVEMNETASIINNISARSLIIMDEIGRGTSTYDGISIALAVIEYLHDNIKKPKTLFATHYHELTKISSYYKRIKNFNVLIKKINEKIIFMYKLLPGKGIDSFGINVAKMAGIPNKILIRAKEILNQIEKNSFKKLQKKKIIKNYNIILEEIKKININSITPIDALLKLNQIKQILLRE